MLKPLVETKYGLPKTFDMEIKTALYTQQKAHWPESGKHILAQFDDNSIIVYQAYRPSIGNFAASHNYFGSDFSYSQMSWIKPNFLRMHSHLAMHLAPQYAKVSASNYATSKVPNAIV